MIMNILVALNANYLYPLKVMLKSLFVNNPKEHFSIYMMHSEMTRESLTGLNAFITAEGHEFISLYVDPALFEKATVIRHFSAEMYYRLIAYLYLPDSVERVLYLDSDIIVLNPISRFYRKPFDEAFFIASEHEYSTKMAGPFNKMRLKTPKAKGYFNTGVLLMNVRELKKSNSAAEVFAYIDQHKHQLLLPDQDVFNAVYWDKIIPASGAYYNYDARSYDIKKLFMISSDLTDLKWIREHTVFVHYCGKQKPWQKTYKGDLGLLFHQYAEMLPPIGIEDGMGAFTNG